MIEYIEEFLGIEDVLTSEFGALIGSVFLLLCSFVVFKTILVWIETIFGKR